MTGQTTANEVPLKKIKDQLTSYPEVNVKVSRQKPNGHWNSIFSNRILPIDQLANMEEHIGKMECGGGRYTVEAFDPLNPLELVVPKFYVNIEGREIAVPDHLKLHPAGGAPAQPQTWFGPQPAPGAQAPAQPYPALGDPQAQPLLAALAAGGFLPGHTRDAQGNVVVEQIASQSVNRMHTDLANEQAARQRERTESDARTERLQDDLLKLKEEMAEKRHKFDLDSLATRLDMLTNQRQAEPPRQALDLVGLAAVVGALAAPITAIIAAKGTRSEAEGKSMTDIVVASLESKKPVSNWGDWVKAVGLIGPLLVPIIEGFFKNRSPSAMAKLMEQATDSQMMGLSMVTQLIQAFPSDEEPVWVPIVRQFVSGLEKAAQTAAEASGHPRIPEDAPPPARQDYRDEQPRAVVDAPADPTNGRAQGGAASAPGRPPPQEMDPREMSAQQIVESLCDHSEGFPEGMKSDAWRKVLLHIHEQQHNQVDNVAEELWDLIRSQHKREILPEVLAPIVADPRNIASVFLHRLPVHKRDEVFTQKLIDKFVQVATPAGQNTPNPDDPPQPTAN